MNGPNLVIWTCPKKHPCVTAFLAPGASTLRLCGATVGKDEYGARIFCNEPMVVAYDERPRTEPLSEAAAEEVKLRRLYTTCVGALDRIRSLESSADIVEWMGQQLKGMRGRKRA